MECRICLDDNKEELYQNICNCKGSLNYIHKNCLFNWMNTKNDMICEICKSKYDIILENEINKFDILYITFLYMLIIFDVEYIVYFIIFYFTNIFLLGIYICILLNMNIIYNTYDTYDTYDNNVFFVLLYYMMLLMYYVCNDRIVLKLNSNKLVKK
jgi:E3 ubiquitin-protein ligase DOA10